MGFDASARTYCTELEVVDYMLPRGSIYTTYGIRHQKNHPYFGFGDLIP